MTITKIKSLWPEGKHFFLYRKSNGSDYVFLHFLSPAEVQIHGQWHKIEAGSFYIAAPHRPQGLRPAGVPILHNWLHIQDSVPGEMATLLQRFHLETDRIYRIYDNNPLTKLFRKLEQEHASPLPYTADAESLWVQELLLEIARQNTAEPVTGNSRLRKKFVAVRENMLIHYDSPPTAEEMAAEVGVSVSHFYKLYREYFGLSPVKELIRVRIEHGERLLSQGNLSVSEVAEALGYENVYHFIRQFKENTGVTPGHYPQSDLNSKEP